MYEIVTNSMSFPTVDETEYNGSIWIGLSYDNVTGYSWIDETDLTFGDNTLIYPWNASLINLQFLNDHLNKHVQLHNY